MTAKSVVVVDRSRSSGVGICNCLAKTDDTAHVFNDFPGALQLMKRKKIDAVVVEFDTDKDTLEFCDAARSLGIPVIYSSAPIEPFDLRQYGFQVVFTELPHAPRMQIQYRPMEH